MKSISLTKIVSLIFSLYGLLMIGMTVAGTSVLLANFTASGAALLSQVNLIPLGLTLTGVIVIIADGLIRKDASLFMSSIMFMLTICFIVGAISFMGAAVSSSAGVQSNLQAQQLSQQIERDIPNIMVWISSAVFCVISAMIFARRRTPD